MKADWEALAKVELAGQALAKDLHISPPCRLVFQVHEQNNWGPCPEGRFVLLPLVSYLPDMKLVEDLHQAIRTDALENPTRRQSPGQIQSVVINSRVLDSREIQHSPMLTEEVVCQKWKVTPDGLKKDTYLASKHKLPEDLSKMMGSKSWPTLSEDTISRSGAAWAWLKHYLGSDLKAIGVKLQAGVVVFVYFKEFLLLTTTDGNDN